MSTLSSPIPYSSLTASPQNPQPLAQVAQAGDTAPGAGGGTESVLSPPAVTLQSLLSVKPATQRC